MFNFRRKSEYSFTPGRDWFNYSEIKREIHKYVDSSRRLVILEIGVFEGLSTMFLADKLLKDPFSKLIAIDPFNSNIDNDHFELLQVENGYSIVEQRFLTNLAKNKKRRQIEFHKTTSDSFFSSNELVFDLIYIDGNHTPEIVRRDLSNSLKCCTPGGIIWMDDYLGGKNGEIKAAIDEELSNSRRNFSIVHHAYQIAIRVD